MLDSDGLTGKQGWSGGMVASALLQDAICGGVGAFSCTYVGLPVSDPTPPQFPPFDPQPTDQRHYHVYPTRPSLPACARARCPPFVDCHRA